MTKMTLDERLIGIIAGAVSAGVVLTIVIIVLVYCLCLKNRQKNELKQVQRNLSVNTLEPVDGMPSTLPKVGSNGLWIPSPSMLTATPSTAYAQAKPNSKQPSDLLYRATSEPKLIDGQSLGGAYRGNLRIYHSQQLAPLHEGYEPGRYDRYLGVRPNTLPHLEDDRMYHSQAMLLENGYQMNHGYVHDEVEPGRSRVRRSASDVTSASQRMKQRAREAMPRRGPYEDRKFTAVVEVHQQRALPVRSYWGQNRGPNKERTSYPKSNGVTDYVSDNSLTRQAQIPSNLYPRQTATWDPSGMYRGSDNMPTATIYSPDDTDSYPSHTVPRYTDTHEDNFKLEVKTTFASQSSAKPFVIDHSIQTRQEVNDVVASTSTNAVSTNHTDIDEDGGYFTSSNRTDITLQREPGFHIEKPIRDIDVASEATDFASTGKDVTAQAFEFLEGYLSDEEANG